MERLLKKFATAKSVVPRPITISAKEPARDGVIFYGSSSAAMREALVALEDQGIHLDAMRIRAFPFHDDVRDFIASHDRVFVVEQNRDAQLRTLLINEEEIDPARLIRVLHFDGTPITARFIQAAIADRAAAANVLPFRKATP
jgi:2-oxoglutarate ferredoxin oxidoreductase subunit alpha